MLPQAEARLVLVGCCNKAPAEARKCQPWSVVVQALLGLVGHCLLLSDCWVASAGCSFQDGGIVQLCHFAAQLCVYQLNVQLYCKGIW